MHVALSADALKNAQQQATSELLLTLTVENAPPAQVQKVATLLTQPWLAATLTAENQPFTQYQNTQPVISALLTLYGRVLISIPNTEKSDITNALGNYKGLLTVLNQNTEWGTVTPSTTLADFLSSKPPGLFGVTVGTYVQQTLEKTLKGKALTLSDFGFDATRDMQTVVNDFGRVIVTQQQAKPTPVSVAAPATTFRPSQVPYPIMTVPRRIAAGAVKTVITTVALIATIAVVLSHVFSFRPPAVAHVQSQATAISAPERGTAAHPSLGQVAKSAGISALQRSLTFQPAGGPDEGAIASDKLAPAQAPA